MSALQWARRQDFQGLQFGQPTPTLFRLQVTVSFDIAIQRPGSWNISQSQWHGLAASMKASGMPELFLMFPYMEKLGGKVPRVYGRLARALCVPWSNIS